MTKSPKIFQFFFLIFFRKNGQNMIFSNQIFLFLMFPDLPGVKISQKPRFWTSSRVDPATKTSKMPENRSTIRVKSENQYFGRSIVSKSKIFIFSCFFRYFMGFWRTFRCRRPISAKSMHSERACIQGQKDKYKDRDILYHRMGQLAYICGKLPHVSLRRKSRFFDLKTLKNRYFGVIKTNSTKYM